MEEDALVRLITDVILSVSPLRAGNDVFPTLVLGSFLLVEAPNNIIYGGCRLAGVQRFSRWWWATPGEGGADPWRKEKKAHGK